MTNLYALRRILKTIGKLGDGAYHHSRLRDDLDMDIVDLAELHNSLEEVYDIVISAKTFDHFRTVGDIIRFLEAHSAKIP